MNSIRFAFAALRPSCALFAAASTVLAAGTISLAHEGATGVVKDRMDLMDGQKEDMKLIGDMAKGNTPFDAAKAAEAARHISVTSKQIPELFPEGSGGGKSDALPSIWEDFDRFTKSAEDLDRAAADLATALDANSPDWKGAFQKVSDGCKACHQDFRAKKQDRQR
jgi:predicted CxxxxCH...CXXCH cytochrome family protein